MSYQIYKNLVWLNELTLDEAESAFLDCCGSQAWAHRMAAARPFVMMEDLFQTATDVWRTLSTVDHLEAFAAHPKIGSKKAAASQNIRAANWSAGEQSGVDLAVKEVRDELADANSLYEHKFGFIFIVCASGKTAEEMLAVCRARLGNSVQTELAIAGEEQRKITEIRLSKFLEK